MQKKFEDIFKTFYPPVKKFAGMIVKSSHDAEDIAQEVFTAQAEIPVHLLKSGE